MSDIYIPSGNERLPLIKIPFPDLLADQYKLELNSRVIDGKQIESEWELAGALYPFYQSSIGKIGKVLSIGTEYSRKIRNEIRSCELLRGRGEIFYIRDEYAREFLSHFTFGRGVQDMKMQRGGKRAYPIIAGYLPDSSLDWDLPTTIQFSVTHLEDLLS